MYKNDGSSKNIYIKIMSIGQGSSILQLNKWRMTYNLVTFGLVMWISTLLAKVAKLRLLATVGIKSIRECLILIEID